jgi:hypothetical protein
VTTTRRPDVPGLLSAADLELTAATMAEWQLDSGMVPWFPGGHADPWNHVEALMAFGLTGFHTEAERGFQWLADIQRPDGSWHQYYLADRVEQDKLDANTIAYVATGVWHRYLLTGDRGFLESLWPVVERAIDFVLELQTPRGEILWARHPDGTPWTFALLTGSSSVCHSIRCAVAVATELGHERPDWELSVALLAEVVRTRPDGAFAPKHRWAMDWYYPVLCGALSGEAGRHHLAERWDTFVMPERGVRCVSDRPWITAAETCECVMAHLSVGESERALDLFTWAQHLRLDDGRYWTGMVWPDEQTFPGDETSTYSAAAVILAADALSGASAAAHLFTDHDRLPPLLDVSELIAELD